MVIVGLKPTPQTLYKFLKPKVSVSHLDNKMDTDDRSKANIEPLSGCLAWLPVIKVSHSKDVTRGKKKKCCSNIIKCSPFCSRIAKDQIPPSDPMLAFAWGNHLFILRVSVGHENKQGTVNGRMPRVPTPPKSSKKGSNLEFVKVGEWKCKEAIVGIQWINKQVYLYKFSSKETRLNLYIFYRFLFYSHPMKK
jgi:hypothetical protein